MLSGGITVFFYKFVIRDIFAGTVFDIYELLPAFIVASIAIVVVSLITSAPEKEITDDFDSVKEMLKN